MLFSLLKHYLELYITDTALKVSRSLYCFTASISHGVENYFPRLWSVGIPDAIFLKSDSPIAKSRVMLKTASTRGEMFMIVGRQFLKDLVCF